MDNSIEAEDFLWNEENLSKHQVKPQDLEAMKYKKIYAWILDEVYMIDPEPYPQKRGCVVWQKLDQPMHVRNSQKQFKRTIQSIM